MFDASCFPEPPPNGPNRAPVRPTASSAGRRTTSGPEGSPPTPLARPSRRCPASPTLASSGRGGSASPAPNEPNLAPVRPTWVCLVPILNDSTDAPITLGDTRVTDKFRAHEPHAPYPPDLITQRRDWAIWADAATRGVAAPCFSLGSGLFGVGSELGRGSLGAPGGPLRESFPSLGRTQVADQ